MDEPFAYFLGVFAGTGFLQEAKCVLSTHANSKLTEYIAEEFGVPVLPARANKAGVVLADLKVTH